MINGKSHTPAIHPTLSVLRFLQDRNDAHRFLPSDVRVPEVPDPSPAQVRGLLRLLFLWDGFLPATAGNVGELIRPPDCLRLCRAGVQKRTSLAEIVVSLEEIPHSYEAYCALPTNGIIQNIGFPALSCVSLKGSSMIRRLPSGPKEGRSHPQADLV